MRFSEGAGCNLWFDIGSPWLSVSWKGGLSVSSWSTPCCFNEFTEALGMANALVYGGGFKIHHKQLVPKGNQIVLHTGAL